jgi:hypothetical protein
MSSKFRKQYRRIRYKVQGVDYLGFSLRSPVETNEINEKNEIDEYCPEAGSPAAKRRRRSAALP